MDNIKIPEPLKVEHEELHAELVALTKAPGEVGEAARGVATLLHPHFVKEEEYALPPLGLLVAVAQGRVTPDMREVLAMTERLQNDCRTCWPNTGRWSTPSRNSPRPRGWRSGPTRRASLKSSACTPRPKSRCCTRRRSS